MTRIVWGILLILLSLFMLLGFFTANQTGGLIARGLLFLILVVLPAVGGGSLIYSHLRRSRTSRDRIERLRGQTQEAEILRLAKEKGGKLTVADVMAETSLDADTVEDRLLSLITQGFGDFEPTESGTIVYSFYDMQKQREQEAE